jgi:protocatechuate 3,4-dioxygenase beta subunit
MQNSDYFDLGLPADLAMWTRTPLARRRLLRLGTAGIATLLAGCAPRGGSPPGPVSSVPTKTSADGACSEVPVETQGPYPADGSNASNQTLNVLAKSGIVRADLRTSLGTQKVAAGIPTTVELTLINVSSNCAPLAGYALYAWHCDRDGLYSMYSQGATDEDYCRGVQAADANGKVTFQTIFPACYAGRWPHIHFEVYPSLDKATGSANIVRTSQLALPEDICKDVYANAEGYSASTRNLSQLTLATDNIFSDGVSTQMATVTGSIASGFVVKMNVGVAV